MGRTATRQNRNWARQQHRGTRLGDDRFAPCVSFNRQSGVLKAKVIAVLALILCFWAPQSAHAQHVALDESIVTDPLTGTALMGFDIVSYFIDNRAVPGDPERQASYAGRAWYFTTLANRRVFLERPEAFLPSFGGYDAAALAAGVLRAGDPKIFLRMDDRLYFFRDSESRDRAMADPSVLAAAQREWPVLRHKLDP